MVVPLADAVRVTDWAELTLDAVAVKPALVPPDGTVTEEGTETSVLLLAKETLEPPLGAAAVRLTVQLVVAGPVSELASQVIPLSLAAAPDGGFSSIL